MSLFCVYLCDLALVLFVFFSSRRRHTRCGRDWSSDVCSSDLYEISSERGQQQARREAQDGVVGGLVLPERGRRSETADINGDDGQQVTGKTQPDDTPRCAIAVYLGEYISKEVAQRKDNNSSRHEETKQQDDFYG